MSKIHDACEGCDKGNSCLVRWLGQWWKCKKTMEEIKSNFK